jgi:hypothetical protein
MGRTQTEAHSVRPNHLSELALNPLALGAERVPARKPSRRLGGGVGLAPHAAKCCWRTKTESFPPPQGKSPGNGGEGGGGGN